MAGIQRVAMALQYHMSTAYSSLDLSNSVCVMCMCVYLLFVCVCVCACACGFILVFWFPCCCAITIASKQVVWWPALSLPPLEGHVTHVEDGTHMLAILLLT